MPQFLPNFKAVRNTIKSDAEVNFQADQAGKLIIKDTGTEITNVEPNLTMRLLRNASSFVMANNLVWDDGPDQRWEIADDGTINRPGTLMEVGLEGVSAFSIPAGPAGTGGLVHRFIVRDEGDVVVIGNDTPTPEGLGGVENWLGVNVGKDKSLNRPFEVQNLSNLTNVVGVSARFICHSSATLVDGAGSFNEFALNGAGQGETVMARVGAERDGAASTGSFVVDLPTTGSFNEALRVKSTGAMVLQQATSSITVGQSTVHGAGLAVIHNDVATAPTSALIYGKWRTDDFSTNAVLLKLLHETTQTSNDGNGVSIDLSVDDAAIAETVAARISAVRDGGTRVYDTVFYTQNSGTLGEAMRIKAENDVVVQGGLGIHGNTAPAQAAAIADVPTAGSATAADNATAINSILTALRNIGIIAT